MHLQKPQLSCRHTAKQHFDLPITTSQQRPGYLCICIFAYCCSHYAGGGSLSSCRPGWSRMQAGVHVPASEHGRHCARAIAREIIYGRKACLRTGPGPRCITADADVPWPRVASAGRPGRGLCALTAMCLICAVVVAVFISRCPAVESASAAPP